jgi:sporulation protein YlmC with PRC-barrel domain
MFRTSKQLKACTLLARDGEIGRVTDLYIDTEQWALRYFVVDPGKWTKHRQVLIAPESVDAAEWGSHRLPVDLTRDQISRSPGIETDQPVSRQYEAAMRKHYGWQPYWGMVYVDPLGVTALPAPPVLPAPIADQELAGDHHLFSANSVDGYRVLASDGEIGHIEDLIIDERNWAVRYLVVATRNWLPGRKVILSPWWATEIDWREERIHMDLDRESIRNSPPYDPDKTLTLEDAGELHDHYNRPHWNEAEAVADTIVRGDNANVP